MSNNVNIIQQTTIEKCSGRTSKEVVVSDDYGMGVINLEGRSDTFYDNDIELLKMVIHIAKEDALEGIDHVLINVKDNERGMNIEGTWYDWDEIKDVLEANNR